MSEMQSVNQLESVGWKKSIYLGLHEMYCYCINCKSYTWHYWLASPDNESREVKDVCRECNTHQP